MTPIDETRTRMYLMLVVLFGLPVGIVGQMLHIYWSEGNALQAAGRDQARSIVDIPAMRGSILDANGRALAINTARYDLALDPTVEGFAARADSFYHQLGALLPDRTARELRTAVRERYSPQYVLLQRGLTDRQQTEIVSWDVPGVILSPTFDRRYNYGTTAAHVLGYVGANGQGLAGLELAYNEALSGTDGYRVVQRDRHGRIKAMVGGTVVPPKHGQNLRLTIDLVRQAALEDELARGVARTGAAWGTAVAMNPETGAILAMANVPTYNPNQPAAYGSAARRNRAITDRFEPGSTFKLVAATAAIEQGIISIDDSVETGDGWAVFHGYTMKDVTAHGTIPFRDVIALSSNVGVAKTVQKLNPGTFYQYARNFGFGQSTWIDLPGEVRGVLKRPSAWSQTSQTSMSIGYEVAVTPLQLLAAYAALANDGVLMQPYVVAERRSALGTLLWQNRPDSVRRVMKRATARKLLPAFVEAVEDGTAENAQVQHLKVAGKTGTALAISEGSYSAEKARASFVGFFPADDPKVALLVLIGSPQTSMYGGQVAAPIFRRIAERWLSTFPTVMHQVVAEGIPADSIIQQEPHLSPPALPDSTTTMPDLTGLSVRAAVRWLRAHGIEPQVHGHGVVHYQSPAAGAPLGRQAVLTARS
ncbi:penicillin-binding protein [Salisaeta longa]|uniref:penicillin-binding protein n=1 Tax=Salisaeta longa TaxID=503170 RepID=UPI0004084C01|nr:penicillin-binding protein [Salisaeta longa]